MVLGSTFLNKLIISSIDVTVQKLSIDDMNTKDDLTLLKRSMDIPFEHMVSFSKKQQKSPISRNLSNRLIETFAEARTVCYKDSNNNNGQCLTFLVKKDEINFKKDDNQSSTLR